MVMPLAPPSSVSYTHLIFDAVGLGAFTVTGINTAVLAGYGDYRFLAVFLGVLTGVGGGVLRDIMAGQTPYILRKHFYACASIIGAIVYTYLLEWTDGDLAVVVSACLVAVSYTHLIFLRAPAPSHPRSRTKS